MQQTIASQSSRRAVERRQHGADVIVEEQHRGDDDVAARRCRPGSARAPRRRCPIRPRRARTSVEPGKSRCKRALRARSRAGQMTVHRHDDDADRASRQRPKCALASYKRLDGDGGDAAFAGRSARCCGAPCRERRTGSFAVPSRPRPPRSAMSDTGGSATGAAGAASAGAACPAPRCDGAAPSWNSKSSRNIAEQMLFQAHHQRMDPGVEDHVGALEAHLRGVAGREILHMHRAPRSPRRGCPGAWRCAAPSACRAPARAAARRPWPRPRDNRR